MNGYEQIITTMREQGAKRNPATIQIGEMETDTVCMIGDLKLEKDDYIIAEHLTDHEIKFDIENAGELVAKTNTVLDHAHELTELTTKGMKVKVYGALKKGDTVLAQRISDEMYAIIERMVEP